jgi:hypothetical protein
VPEHLIDPRLGLAVLHCQSGQTAIYCADSQITGRAAEALSALASRAARIVSLAPPPDPGHLVTVTRVNHELLPADLHPAVAIHRSKDADFLVCRDLITPGLAMTLSLLATAQARYLAGRPQLTALHDPSERTAHPGQIPAAWNSRAELPGHPLATCSPCRKLGA